MKNSTVTTKGQTAIRVHPGTRSLKGSLSSNRGRGLTFAPIRGAAAKAARAHGDGR
jgi:hypothetical protein